MGQNAVPYAYAWASHMSIRIWDVPYAYGPIYALWGRTATSYYLTTTDERIRVSIMPGTKLQNATPGYTSGI